MEKAKKECSYSLEFLGYTWDEYFHVIGNKSGILVVYKGGLDSEGFIKLDEIVYVDEADRLYAIYDSNGFIGIRNNIDKTYRLFYTYAEMRGIDRRYVANRLKKILLSHDSNNFIKSDFRISCKGACALFPQIIL